MQQNNCYVSAIPSVGTGGAPTNPAASWAQILLLPSLKEGLLQLLRRLLSATLIINYRKA